ncbi:MAG TPA: GGDEF domain-containing protein [Pseudonocardiaceae bacterium]|nr:GGDEF domain-containing protein [Pseudonocardiaceae bacterium]
MSNGLARFSPAAWSLWKQPRAVVSYVLAVDLVAVGLITASPWMAPVYQVDLGRLVILVLVSVVNVECGRSIERVREIAAEGAPYVNLQAVWIFAGLLLLPPPLLAILVAVTYTHMWFRVSRRIVVHRWVFSAATVVLACGIAATILAASIGYPGLPMQGPTGLLAIVAAALAYWLVNYSLVVGAILLSTPDAPARAAMGDPGDQLIMAATIGLGVAMAALLAFLPWLVIVLTATVLALHRGLLVHQLQAAARADAKTGLANSVHWFDIAHKELARARRLGNTLGVLIIDLDHFKRVNDARGHLVGDAVIVAVSRVLKREVRSYDLVGRFGGDEFAVLLPAVDSEGELLRIAERIRERVAELEVPVPPATDRAGQPVVRGLTISVGVAAHPAHGRSIERLVLAADTACYAAKNAGRNRVHLAAPGDPVAATPVLPPGSAGQLPSSVDGIA